MAFRSEATQRFTASVEDKVAGGNMPRKYWSFQQVASSALGHAEDPAREGLTAALPASHPLPVWIAVAREQLGEIPPTVVRPERIGASELIPSPAAGEREVRAAD